jgi:hypothetical protein
MSQWIKYVFEFWPDDYKNEWNGPGYYFWNPISEAYGPFPSEEEATKALMEYMRTF